MLTDTHAHLYYPEVIENLDEILNRAKDSGIERIIVPAVDLVSSMKVIELTEKYEMIYAALGVHPGDVSKNKPDVIDKIEKLLSHEKVVAVGEIGLDYYWDTSFVKEQKEFFTLQIEMAMSHNLPVVIHTRDSTGDAISIVESFSGKNLKGQFHCFTGNEIELDKILNMKNMFISYCGNITYKNFSSPEVIVKSPLDRLLSETDSPFLPPVPYRGKKNEPLYMLKTLEKISEIKSVGLDEIKEAVSKNAVELFFGKKF
ncbi:MAG: TatD family hydrolase [Ignavibacteria bacterium]|nr:TatD family hydrolase [Ignavibacteria bacterium]